MQESCCPEKAWCFGYGTFYAQAVGDAMKEVMFCRRAKLRREGKIRGSEEYSALLFPY
jgi:hypothetical protein